MEESMKELRTPPPQLEARGSSLNPRNGATKPEPGRFHTPKISSGTQDIHSQTRHKLQTFRQHHLPSRPCRLSLSSSLVEGRTVCGQCAGRQGRRSFPCGGDFADGLLAKGLNSTRSWFTSNEPRGATMPPRPAPAQHCFANENQLRPP